MNTITLNYIETGRRLYAMLVNESGEYYSTASEAFIALVVGNWSDYLIDLTETPAGSYSYVFTMPAAGAASGRYTLRYQDSEDAGPAIHDASFRFDGGDITPIELDASAVRAAVGLAAANLDTQLAGVIAAGDARWATAAGFATADDIAGLLDAPLAGHATSGTVGEALANVGSVEGLDDLADTVDAIKAKTDLIGSAIIAVVGPAFDGEELSIVAGDDYLAADGRALSWTVSTWGGPDLTGAAVKLHLIGQADRDDGETTSEVVIDGSAAMADAAAVFTVPLTAAQTAALTPSTAAQYYSYVYQLRVTTAAGRVLTIATNTVHVEAGLEAGA